MRMVRASFSVEEDSHTDHGSDTSEDLEEDGVQGDEDEAELNHLLATGD